MHDVTPKKSPHAKEKSPRTKEISPRTKETSPRTIGNSPSNFRGDENRRSIGRSSSQHTLGPRGSKVNPTNPSLRTKEKLNATVRVDPNISIDNVNRSDYSAIDRDGRKTQSDSKR